MSMCDNCLSTNDVQKVVGTMRDAELCSDCRTLRHFDIPIDKTRSIDGERYLKEEDVVKALAGYKEAEEEAKA